jgi:hypothetical protein
MTTDARAKSSNGNPKLKPWIRRLWVATAFGLLITISPFAIALAGLALNSQYLMTYHWLVYFTAPVGLMITLVSALVAAGMMVREHLNGCNRSGT